MQLVTKLHQQKRTTLQSILRNIGYKHQEVKILKTFYIGLFYKQHVLRCVIRKTALIEGKHFFSYRAFCTLHRTVKHEIMAQ